MNGLLQGCRSSKNRLSVYNVDLDNVARLPRLHSCCSSDLPAEARCFGRRPLSPKTAMLEFPSSLPPQPARPNARMPSAERDLLPRHLGSRKMRRFINDNFIDSVVEMNGDEDEPYHGGELKGTTFSNPAVLMMISEEEFVTEAKPRIRQVCLAPLGRIGRVGG